MNGRTERDDLQAIILNCFGRGGSSMLWNFIGSSPDVLMSDDEWHVAMYGRAGLLRRAVRQATRPGSLDLPMLPGVAGLVRRRTRALIGGSHDNDPRRASAMVLKLMDHHMAWNGVLRGAFPGARQVVLVRHPYGLCESLVRSGLGWDRAALWYVEVAERMRRVVERHGGLLIRFEDFVKRPIAATRGLYRALDIALPQPEAFYMKDKCFGDARQGNALALGSMVLVNAANAGALIDPRVSEAAASRLPPEIKARIWRRAGRIAAGFGYEEGGFAAEPVDSGDVGYGRAA